MDSNLTFKITLIGNKNVGKSSLVYRFLQRQIPIKYEPAAGFSISSQIVINDQKINLIIYDVPEDERYRKFRSKTYPRSDGFILCFSLGDITSFNNIESVWEREIMRYFPQKPYILVGTKSDSRRRLSKQHGVTVKKRISAADYVECSALLDENVNQVFESITNAIIEYREFLVNGPKKKCSCRCCCCRKNKKEDMNKSGSEYFYLFFIFIESYWRNLFYHQTKLYIFC